MTDATNLNELRARRDELDRQLAAGTITAAEELAALLGSDELTQMLDRLTAAAETLDDATKRRLEQWVKNRDAMVKLGAFELARLRQLAG